jgi:hypothetical protein
MRQVRRAAEEIASHRRSGRSAGSVALAPSATASGAGHHEQIDRSRCESNTVDCRRHRQTLNSAEPTSAMSEHGTFGRFRPLARAWPPSGGKISASAALSASACRTRRSARPGSARTRTHRPRITAAPRVLSRSASLTRRHTSDGAIFGMTSDPVLTGPACRTPWRQARASIPGSTGTSCQFRVRLVRPVVQVCRKPEPLRLRRQHIEHAAG